VAASVKDMLMDMVDAARESGRRLLDDFKEQSRFFKARAGIVAGYVFMVVFSILVIPPGGEKNPLDAKVKVDSISFGSRGKTFVEVTNEGRAMWETVKVSITGSCVRNGTPITGTWSTSDRIRRGESKTFFGEQFKDAQGFKPEIDVVVDSVTLEVDGVRWTKDARKKGGRP
jgi:hypothetical protein